ncbi:AAA family ATPase [Streptomyces acidiscabies]|uniref:AAA family ATPase n=1 Tax=Streptomyces acidiscabies TaxID=42234 RepID=UPI00095218B8|nr:AAA family ATPase [Streptomyces acidiscabies]
MADGVGVAAAATYDQKATADRGKVLDEFPLAAWPTMPLDRYVLGLGSTGTSYCWRLEFGAPHLGSIRGGSAAKHIMYRHNSGEWRLAAPLRGLDAQAAWEKLRTQFVRAFEAVANEDFDALDDLEVLRFGPALVTKSLATYFPEHFLPVYSTEHLRKFVGVLGGTVPAGYPAWRINRLLLELVRSRPQFANWSPYEVMTYLYEHFDPRPQTRTIWKIAPGERGRFWEECRDGGFICVGWDDIGDLGNFQTDTELARHWPHNSLTTARRLLAFRDLEVGDRIVANRGTSEILATGTVSGSYRFMPERPEYQHVVDVDWDVSHAQKLPKPQHSWRSTFAKVDPALFARITSRRPEPAAPPADVQTVLDALTRKGQAILHGPPGTGKTRLALSTALALAGRTEAITADPVQRAAAQAEILGGEQFRLVTFHPSYGYEDFVEGFKPDLGATAPGLTLTLADGLFHRLCKQAAAHPDQTHLLVIDEINRGDLPRVFGELVTLLELDKRGLPLVLPISGRTFSVPPNIRIIGTMNTADRSISHLDAAVRRRFAFLPIEPDPDVVSGTVGPLDLAEFFESLNSRIAKHLDADRQVGHAYFLRDGEPIATDEELAAVFHHEVIPLLEDFCLGRADLLHRILGDLVDADTGRVAQRSPQDLAAALAAEFTSGDPGA